jgi:hypothetical protein
VKRDANMNNEIVLDGLRITVELITPDIAERWLNELNTLNRALREGVAEQYAADMANGKWTRCVAPIVFYGDGALSDGQHRLYAIVLSETPQTFFVVRGLDRESGLNIDVGLMRTLIDNGRISGVDTGLSANLLAATRAVATGMPASDRLSNAQKLELVNEHRAACEWALSVLPRTKNIHNAPVFGALARAWYHEKDKDRLAKFAQVVGTGFSDGDADSAAIAMRNYLIEHAGVAASSAMWRDTFLKVQNSISYFMQRKKLTYIKSVKEDVYPLKKKRATKA